jgi:hypothetical protein
MGSPGSPGEALPPPARQVRHHGIPCDSHLRLDEQHPSPRPSTASLKGAIEGRQDAALGSAVLQPGARQRVELAADQVSDVGGWDTIEVRQGGRSSGAWTEVGNRGLGHSKSLRRAVLPLHPRDDEEPPLRVDRGLLGHREAPVQDGSEASGSPRRPRARWSGGIRVAEKPPCKVAEGPILAGVRRVREDLELPGLPEHRGHLVGGGPDSRGHLLGGPVQGRVEARPTTRLRICAAAKRP